MYNDLVVFGELEGCFLIWLSVSEFYPEFFVVCDGRPDPMSIMADDLCRPQSRIVFVTDDEDIFFDIFFDDKSWTTTESEPFSLSDRIEKRTWMRPDHLACRIAYLARRRTEPISQKFFHRYLADEA